MTVSLLQACDDPKLFNFPLWPRQRELLQAVEKGPRLQVWALGRRSGKTTLAALVGLHGCLFRPDLDDKVRPGERRQSVVVATNIDQARILLDAARSIVEHSPLLDEMVEGYTENSIRFTNGTVFAALPCSSRGLRGRAVSHFFMDEAAFFLTETDGYQTADKVWQAATPSAAQFGDGGRVIVSSTPYGTEGLFASLYRQAAGGELEDAAGHHATTAEVNPTIDDAFLDREHKRDPDSFRAEYLAEFTGSGNAYLDFERIEVAERGTLEPEDATGWVIGLDPAFSRDPFGYAIVGRDPDDPARLLTGKVDALKPKGAFTGPVDTVAEMARLYGAKVVTDQYAAAAVLERLKGHGLSVRLHNMSASSKTAVFAELRARLYDGSLELYEHDTLIPELRRLRTKYTAGSAAIENPRVGGSHGDIAQALALAVYELRRQPREAATVLSITRPSPWGRT